MNEIELCKYCKEPRFGPDKELKDGWDITEWYPWTLYYCSPECEKADTTP